MDTFELIKIISSLTSMVGATISVVKAYRGGREEVSKLDRTKISRAGELTATAGGGAVNKEFVIALGIIPDDILDATANRIKLARGRYIRAIDSPLSIFELERESELAQFEICNLLMLIKKHNNNELPTEELKKLWISFGCGKKKKP